MVGLHTKFCAEKTLVLGSEGQCCLHAFTASLPCLSPWWHVPVLSLSSTLFHYPLSVCLMPDAVISLSGCGRQRIMFRWAYFSLNIPHVLLLLAAKGSTRLFWFYSTFTSSRIHFASPHFTIISILFYVCKNSKHKLSPVFHVVLENICQTLMWIKPTTLANYVYKCTLPCNVLSLER